MSQVSQVGCESHESPGNLIVASDEISQELKLFIMRQISSVAQLEAVLLLSSALAKDWTAESLSRELRTNPSYAETHLQQMERSGLVIKCSETAYRFTDDPSTLAMVEALRATYVSRRISVINLIYAHPLEKIRDLADAFVFRKD